MAHDGVNHFALIVSLFTLHNIFGRHPALRKINVTYSPAWLARVEAREATIHTLLLINSENYYDLIYSRENVEVQRKAVELAERLVMENQKKLEVGALAPLDLASAQAQAAQSRIRFFVAV